MAKVEIYELVSGEVIETQEIENMTAFRHYFNAQCNAAEYGFRILGGVDKPVEWRVIKEPDGHHCTGGREPEFLPLTDELVAEISSFNGGLSPIEVHAALMQGRTIYTTFSRYRLES